MTANIYLLKMLKVFVDTFPDNCYLHYKWDTRVLKDL